MIRIFSGVPETTKTVVHVFDARKTRGERFDFYPKVINSVVDVARRERN